ncbi:Protein gts1, partial [Teratosphaeriaceae sp. CCFEE 6253]
MTSAISKRQQARNERALQELLLQPGNDKCADCAATNPGWASWNLGVFLCMRCGGLHRKLGTHVSKVKSLSMDSWSTEQVDNMKKIGNVEGNRRWNPKAARPGLPVDADEVDGAVERFIRLKYEQRAFAAGGGGAGPAPPALRRDTTGSTGTGSWSEEPPPLPPKPGKRFAGFSLRSASSVLPRGHRKEDRARNFTPPLSPAFSGSDSPPPQIKERNKPSQMFGMKITGVGNNFDAKLATLRDMGFSDNRRNSDVLKRENGSLDRAIESLVRLGEGGGKSAVGEEAFDRALTPAPTNQRSLTPVSMASGGVSGISIDKTRPSEKKAASNPWEIRESTPQRAATQPLPDPPRSQSVQPAGSHWNPFLSQSQGQPQQQGLVEGMQTLQVSQTGPGASSQAYGQQQSQYQAPNPWNTPSFAQHPQQQIALGAGYGGLQYQQPQVQPSLADQQQPPAPAQQQQSVNPFLKRATSQTFAQSNPWGQSAPQQQMQQPSNPWSQQQGTAPALTVGDPWGQTTQQQAPHIQQGSNPFGMPYAQQSVFRQAPTQSPAPTFGQTEFFTQQAQPQPQQVQHMQHQQPQVPNPYAQQQQQFTQPQQLGIQIQQPQQYQPQLPVQPQPPQEQPWMYREANPISQPQQQQRVDKSSILGLYSMAPPQQQQRALQPVMEDGGQAQIQHPSQQSQQSQQPTYQPQQRSVTMPLQQQTTSNPFGVQQQQVAFPPQGVRHVSNESAAFVGFAGEGRHSPDAFAGLSAR